MSFEETYRKSIEASAPDLWDRISAGIDALEAESQTERNADSVADNVVAFTAKPKKKKSIARYSGAIAAAVVFVLAIPGFILANRAKREDAATEMMATVAEESSHSKSDKSDKTDKPNRQNFIADVVNEATAGVMEAESTDYVCEDVCETVTEETQDANYAPVEIEENDKDISGAVSESESKGITYEGKGKLVEIESDKVTIYIVEPTEFMEKGATLEFLLRSDVTYPAYLLEPGTKIQFVISVEDDIFYLEEIKEL